VFQALMALQLETGVILQPVVFCTGLAGFEPCTCYACGGAFSWAHSSSSIGSSSSSSITVAVGTQNMFVVSGKQRTGSRVVCGGCVGTPCKRGCVVAVTS
jgi:Fe-S-cluster-containing hydrogenase component 2